MEIIKREINNLGFEKTSIQQFLFKKPATCFCGSEKFCVNEINCITKQITNGINAERKGTKYSPITEKRVALMLNRHPLIAKDLEQRVFILKRCKEIGYGKMFFWVTKMQ